MNTIEIRQQIQEYVDQLSPERYLLNISGLRVIGASMNNQRNEEKTAHE